MFIRTYTVVDRPFAEVEAEFVKGAANWMPDLALKANGHGVRLLSELGLKMGPRRIGKRIELKISEPLRSPGLTLFSMRWQAASEAGFFPALEGQMEIAALGGSSTQLGLSGTYRPPLGIVGAIADRALLHRVAEVTVKDFIERIGDRLKA